MAPPLQHTCAERERQPLIVIGWAEGDRSDHPMTVSAPRDDLASSSGPGADRTPDERKRHCSMAEPFPRVAIIQGSLTPIAVSPQASRSPITAWHQIRLVRVVAPVATRRAGARDTSALGPRSVTHSTSPPVEKAAGCYGLEDFHILTVGRHFVSSTMVGEASAHSNRRTAGAEVAQDGGRGHASIGTDPRDDGAEPRRGAGCVGPAATAFAPRPATMTAGRFRSLHVAVAGQGVWRPIRQNHASRGLISSCPEDAGHRPPGPVRRRRCRAGARRRSRSSRHRR